MAELGIGLVESSAGFSPVAGVSIPPKAAISKFFIVPTYKEKQTRGWFRSEVNAESAAWLDCVPVGPFSCGDPTTFCRWQLSTQSKQLEGRRLTSSVACATPRAR